MNRSNLMTNEKDSPDFIEMINKQQISMPNPSSGQSQANLLADGLKGNKQSFTLQGLAQNRTNSHVALTSKEWTENQLLAELDN